MPKIFIVLNEHGGGTLEKESPYNESLGYNFSHIFPGILQQLLPFENLQNLTVDSDFYVVQNREMKVDDGMRKGAYMEKAEEIHEIYFLKRKLFIQPIDIKSSLIHPFGSMNFSYFTEILRKGQRRGNFQQVEIVGISQVYSKLK